MTKTLPPDQPATSTPCTLNPTAYEIPSTSQLPLATSQELATALCSNCPLLTTCSQYAVDVLRGSRGVQQKSWAGLIIAGVPTGSAPRLADRLAALAALEVIANGHSIEEAHYIQAKLLNEDMLP